MIKLVFHLFRYCFYFLIFIFARLKPINKNVFAVDLKIFLERMGPLFVKIGQFLSTRSDLFDLATIEQLSLLKDAAKSFSFKHVKRIVENDLNCSIDKEFLLFEETPIAAASIAQVHFAITKDNIKVAVKVLRPNLKKEINTLKILTLFLIKAFDLFSKKAKRLRLFDIHRLLFKRLEAEIDLRLEGANATKFKAQFSSNESLLVPSVFWSLTSKRVLTLEWIDFFNCKAKPDVVSSKLIEIAVYCFLDQVCINGFFHGDLHSGNVGFFESKICFVDFGIMGYASKKIRLYLFETLAGFATKDYRRVANAHFDSGYVDEMKYSRDEFSTAMLSIGEKIVGKKLNEIKISDLLFHLFDVAGYFDMDVQLPLLLLQKNSLIFEDLIKSIFPEASIWMYTEKWILQRRGIIDKIYAFSNIKLYSGIEKIKYSINDIVCSMSKRENNKINFSIKLHLILLIVIIIIIV